MNIICVLFCKAVFAASVLKSNRFEIDIKEGVNDLGVIEIPESEFE